jgi:hypothetical protein
MIGGGGAGLAPVRCFVGLGQWTLLVGPFIGEIYRVWRNDLEPLALRLSGAGRVSVFITMKQV